jgi:beta-galactosidase
MRVLLLTILCLGACSILHAERQTQELSSGWKFIKHDAGIMAATDGWETVTVPHTWNAMDGQAGGGPIVDENQNLADADAAATARKAKMQRTDDPSLKDGYYRGACWYARTLEVPADWKGKKRVFIRFEAASLVAKTYINKKLLGEHRGAFTAFCYELTNYLDYGKPNELRVQVDNSHREDLQPLSGDFNVDGGLYRPVQLIVTDNLCVSPLDFASPGIYLTTKSLDDKQAVIEVTSLISSGTTPEKVAPEIPPTKVTIETEIKDADGKSVAKADADQNAPGEEATTVMQTLTLADPHLWQGRKDPYLYTVTVRVLSDGQSVDEVTQPLGLRTVAITKEQGFLLNGQAYPIHGVCRHQDLRDKGWAITAADEESDMQFITELGATAIRNAHYPQSESWHQLGDRLGLLMWDEVTVVNETRTTRAFWENTDEQMREMVHQLYNHPSIAWWGMFNELDNLHTPPSGPGLEQLKAIAKDFDPSRIVVAASDHGDRYYNLIPDQIAFNNYPGWYGGDWPKEENYHGNLDQMAGFIDFRVKEVGKRIGISEYGAGGDIAHHIEGPPMKPHPAHGGPFQPEEWQAYVHERDWEQMKDNPNLWGTFLWCMFDFAAANRHEGSMPNLNTKGLVTHDRKVKKDAYFFYQANWTTQPMVYIASRRSVTRTQPTTEIKVYSNCDAVELKVNGQSIGSAKPNSVDVFRWADVQLKTGPNLIEVTGHSSASTVSDSCRWILQPISPAAPLAK